MAIPPLKPLVRRSSTFCDLLEVWNVWLDSINVHGKTVCNTPLVGSANVIYYANVSQCTVRLHGPLDPQAVIIALPRKRRKHPLVRWGVNGRWPGDRVPVAAKGDRRSFPTRDFRPKMMEANAVAWQFDTNDFAHSHTRGVHQSEKQLVMQRRRGLQNRRNFVGAENHGQLLASPRHDKPESHACASCSSWTPSTNSSAARGPSPMSMPSRTKQPSRSGVPVT